MAAGSWLNGWNPDDYIPASEMNHGWGCFYDHTTSGTDATIPVTLPTWGVDVMFTFQLASDTPGDTALLIINGDSGANYYTQSFFGSGSSALAAAGTGNSMDICALPNSANLSATGKILIPNYRGTTFYKQAEVVYFAETSSGVSATSNLTGNSWHSTAAITTVTFDAGGNYVTGSRVRGYVSG